MAWLLNVDRFEPPRDDGPLRIFRKGDVVDGLDDAEVERLLKCGALVSDTPVMAPPAPVVADAPAAPPEEPDEESPTVRHTRPAKSAPLAKWKNYAESLGIDTKQLKEKAAIIAAVNAH